MSTVQISFWQSNEAGYLKYLTSERRLFAWCLVHQGSVSWPDATAAAEQFYPYESATEPYRGLIFHDEAWHLAMLQLFGERYWTVHPELESPSAKYRAEASRLQQSAA